ncbi:MAG TPA: hypothetical protein VK866_17310 [Acidimicrobiales bacterium]|nr:hypothetical protein [Acidimicrobiales bacterium]
MPSRSAIRPGGVPAPLAAALRDGLRLRADATIGPTLELIGPPAAPVPTPPPGGYALVLTAGWLGAAPDIDAAATALVAALAPDGRVDCVEPSAAAGALARVQRWSAAAVRTGTGLHVDRDVPVVLRRAGLVLTDIERFSMPTRLPVLRPFVRVRGHRRSGSAS